MSVSDEPTPAVKAKVAALIKEKGLKPGDAMYMEDEHRDLHDQKVARETTKNRNGNG